MSAKALVQPAASAAADPMPKVRSLCACGPLRELTKGSNRLAAATGASGKVVEATMAQG